LVVKGTQWGVVLDKLVGDQQVRDGLRKIARVATAPIRSTGGNFDRRKLGFQIPASTALSEWDDV